MKPESDARVVPAGRAPPGRHFREALSGSRASRRVGLVFVMRPAVAGDQEPIAAMIRARSAWMRERGVNGSGRLGVSSPAASRAGR